MTSKNCKSKNILVFEILAFNCTENSEKSKFLKKSHLFKVLSNFSQEMLLRFSISFFETIVLIASDFVLVLFFLKAYAEIPCVKQVNSSLHKQSLISQNVSLSVRPSVCLSDESSVCSHEWIFLKFCMKLDDVVNRRTTEPDFRFSISFRTYCPKSVKNGRFSSFFEVFGKYLKNASITFWNFLICCSSHSKLSYCSSHMSGKNLIRKLQCPKVVRKSIKCPGPFFEMIRKLFQKSRYFLT